MPASTSIRAPIRELARVGRFARDLDLKASRDIDADRPGRTFDSGGEGRHAMEPPTDAKRHAKQEFHRELAADIETALKAGEFDRLVIVAAPATLGDLRQEFSKTVTDKIHGEIPKNLVKAGQQELLDQLGTVLPV